MPNIYMSNLTGLLDVDAMVQGLLQSKTENIKKLQNQRALLQAQASSLNNLLSGLNELNSFVESLNINELFTGKSVKIGDPTILSATAESYTPNININTLTVAKLPQEEIRVSSAGVTDLNSPIDSATFTLRYWTSATNYEETTIQFSGGTLQDLVNTINSAQNKVSASILFDGTYYKLMLSEKDMANSTKETDVANNSYVIEISSGSLPTQLGTLSPFQSAQNAEIQIGSTYFSSPSNTFKDIISGLTINVYKLGTTSLSVSNDYSKVSTDLNELLKKINNVVELVNSQTDKGEIFQGNVVITQIKVQFFSQLNPLINLGIINIDDKGNYSLNTEILNNLVKNNPELLQSSISQVKDNFSLALNALINTIKTYSSAQDQQIERINKEIERLQKTLAKEEEKLRIEFSKIEALMYHNEQLRARLESMVTPISEMFKRD